MKVFSFFLMLFAFNAFAQVIEVNADTFQQLVLDSKEPVVVEFFATWCPPCQRFAPQYEAIAQEFSSEIKFTKYDVGPRGNRVVFNQYKLSAVPTFHFYKDGKCVGSETGSISRDVFCKHFREDFWLKKSM